MFAIPTGLVLRLPVYGLTEYSLTPSAIDLDDVTGDVGRITQSVILLHSILLHLSELGFLHSTAVLAAQLLPTVLLLAYR